ncbi:hypothetical protein COU53_02555 [Candidatus Pacearchaeota archaeon CG10_big_fil_rev_8_21_14_0_10_30_48]|nr:MAG: hypothetical protein COU53_02555 [Candidatus Pacearchaeota archaeon CG10_big_fil_rev_8_21_14_0_10_30_48]
MKKLNLTELDNVTKILLILLIGVILYFIMFMVLSPFLIREPTSMAEVMNQMMGANDSSIIINLLSLIIAIIIALIVSFYLFRQNGKEQEYKILRKVLSDDEKKILDEIKKAGEITQDSLRFRLDWSKAKISTILTNLDKRNLIQRKRIGKTYNVYLQK